MAGAAPPAGWWAGHPPKVGRLGSEASGAPTAPTTGGAAGRARLPGAIECETMELAPRADGLVVETQDLDSIAPERTWSAGCVLLARGRKVGDFVELRVPVPGTGPKRLKVRTAKSFDYGILRFSVDGRAIGRDLDTYSADIVPSEFVELGTIEPRDGRIVLRVEVVGCNPQSRPPNYYFGLDCVQAVDAVPADAAPGAAAPGAGPDASTQR